MKVKILVEAPYSDFKPGRAPGAKVLKEGEIVNLPDAYAKGLIEAGLVEAAQVENPEEPAVVDAEDAPVEDTPIEDSPEEEAPVEEKPKTVVRKRAKKE
jgi:hypothetical protein